MNSKKLKDSINIFKNHIGDALLSSDIWDKKDGLSIASYRLNERYAAQFGRIISKMEIALDDLGYPALGEYQLIDLESDYLLFIMQFEQKYIWGSLIDKTKVSLSDIIFKARRKAKISFIEALEHIDIEDDNGEIKEI